MTATETLSSGTVEPGFDGVRDAFEAALAEDGASGAGLSIRQDGRTVVDLWGGTADAETGRAWTSATPSVIFSATKGVMSILIARLVQDGLLDYDAPVARYWPEFGRAGKAEVTVGDAVAHRAGLSAPVVDWTTDDLLDWDRSVALLADQEPLWRPGSGWAYHAITHGWLTGEIVRRVTGSMPGAYLSRLATDPLGIDAWIGLPSDRAGDAATLQVGRTLRALTLRQREAIDAGASVWPQRALTLGGALPVELVGPGEGFNRPDVQAAQIPGAGGIATAHALAAFWSAVVAETDGVRLVDDETARAVAVVRSEGAPVFSSPPPWPRWGRGVQLDSEARRYLGSSSIGHDGAGGQVAFADLDARIGFAFLTNRMEADDDRATRIVEALRQALTAPAAA
ncbi:serine hydrolase domain-containing protein [Frondihabitans peucedani]|uniref:Serine hydrolase domain-containing protein n=1 Tax=Frondihabitans peucedani TaxID=598626 RepID=A0ABP8E5C2_9MICO